MGDFLGYFEEAETFLTQKLPLSRLPASVADPDPVPF